MDKNVEVSGKGGLNFYEHHIKTYGNHKNFGYKDFIPLFKAEKFDAAEWSELFKESGAKFVMPVAEHHDGFCMYDTELSDWNSVQMGPKRDVLGELKQELEKRNIIFTASSHRAEHYWFMSGGREFDSDFPKEIEYGDLYWTSYKDQFNHFRDLKYMNDGKMDELFFNDWLVRTCELIDKYQPQIVYFDGGIHMKQMKPYLQKMAAYYYNRAIEWKKEVAINYKEDSFMHSTAVRDIERGQLADISPDYWQNDTSVAKNSWGYTNANSYKRADSIICNLIDVVSKNGSFLLNIDPKADGTIPQETVNILMEIGQWMKINGEAIYETSSWKKYGEGPTFTKEGLMTEQFREEYTTEDFRFTFKEGIIYAFAMKLPQDGVVRIKAFGKIPYYLGRSLKKLKS